MTRPLRQAGAALLTAMLTVALVASLASAALWQQWRSVEVEAAERARVQSLWVLTGALDWARLILREDARSGGPDSLSEPWAVPLEEARLSTFLAADKNNTADSDASASQAFLSGLISDLQARLNVTNLVDNGKVSEPALQAFAKLFEQLGLPPAELTALAENLRQALDTRPENDAASVAPLLPQRVEQLVWLGLSPASLAILRPYITLLPVRTPVNLNTASREVIAASVEGLDVGAAERLVQLRKRTPFTTVAEAQAALPPNLTLESTRVGVLSNFFEVRGRVRLGDRALEELSLVERRGLDIVPLQRQRFSLQDTAG